jgi:ATP-dependent helicase/nuclease subunit B
MMTRTSFARRAIAANIHPLMGSLRFILGRAGSGKTTSIVSEISQLLRDDPLGDPILLLVPDQATLLYERLLACGGSPEVRGQESEVRGQRSEVRGQESGVRGQGSGNAGYLRLTVITFRHLIERLLGEGGGSAIPEITPLGRRILIGRLLRRMQPQLTYYRSTARQPGLATRLDEAFAEIERSGRNLDDLLFIAGDVEAQNPRSSLPAKLRDLHALIKEYETVLGTERLDQHRRFIGAIKAAEQSPTLGRTRVYVDDFYDFTSTERTLLVQLARHSAQLSVALAVDPKAVNALATDVPLDEEMLLHGSSMAFRRLHKLAADSKVKIETQVMTTSPRFESPELLHIDRQFDSARPGKFTPEGNIEFVEAVTKRDEVDAAARQIQQWVRNGMRLRDILVLARDVSQYERDVEASFRDHGLSCFIDRQRPASHHPLIRTVRALLQLPLTDFRHDVVIDLIKAGLCGVTHDASDELENYLLAHRVRGTEAWSTAWAYQSRRRSDDEPDDAVREQIESINATRARLYGAVSSLITDETARPAGEWCVRICKALDGLEVHTALAKQITAREAEGKLELAASDQAVWTEFTELLDQLCSVLSEETLTLREYAEVMDVALERFTLAITPPTIDQVLVGSVDRTRSANIKACIVLGLAEGIFPRRFEEVAALSDDDRHHLDARQFELKSNTRCQLMDEQTLAYLAFTRPSQKLMLVRSLASEDGRPIGPSLFWTHLLRLFKEPPIRKSEESAIDSIATAGQLAEAVVDWAHTSEVPVADAPALTKWFTSASELHLVRAREALLSAMRYDNEASLSPAIAKQLFPSPLKMSATRLETFAACPFKHFSQYTLGLKPREETELTRLDLGSVYHDVLENLIGDAIRAKTNLAEPIPDLQNKIRSLSEVAAAELRSEFMLTPGRNRYLLEGVRNTVEHIVETQRHTIGAGAFRPKQTEFAFGFDGRHPPLSIMTPKGHEVQLRGRIDRIDTWSMGDRIAASVVDYKLGDQRPNFARIRHGLNLQLLTYLLVLDAMGEKLVGAAVQPAAAFYVRLLRQIETLDHPSEKPDPDEPATYMKKYKPRGVVDERFASSIDSAERFPLKVRKEKTKLNQGDVLSPEAFERIIDWTRGKIAELADRIIGGAIEVRPYRIKTQTPCSTCNYRPVCRLDLAFNRYLNITIPSPAALEEIAGEPS